MKIPLSLLQEFLPNLKLSPSTIAEQLNLAGIEVDAIENEIASFSGVVSAYVEEVSPHPSADRLVVATVFDGKEKNQVVCGASNCRKGIYVAYAKVGATLDDEGKKFKIKKAKLRGVESFGMICSEDELGLAEKSEGILELDPKTELGLDLSLQLCDPVFDISLTPNLGHCMSALGIAREIAALNDLKVKMPKFSLKEEGPDIAKKIKVEVESTDCGRYSCRYLEDITLCESPSWLKQKLTASGNRPINAVVDVLNYVMILTGQPMHAFDYDKLNNQTIKVVEEKKKQKFLTLDQENRELCEDILMIYDAKNPIAVAGVIGGEESAVSEMTKNILIESAYFDAKSVRKSSKALGVRTESSNRFEKGIDPNGILFALDYASFLIHQICQGKTAKNSLDVKIKTFEETKITCRLRRASDILGIPLSVSEVESIFNRLNFSVKIEDELFYVTVPSYRNDLLLEIDLIEEIGRIYGFNNIERKKPKYSSSYLPHDRVYLFEQKIRNRLLGEGLQELITTDLISKKLAKVSLEESLPLSSFIEVLHAKSSDHSILRASLLPSFLQVIEHNFSHKVSDIQGFEISRLHFKDHDQLIEQDAVGIVLTGKNIPPYWDKTEKEVDFFDLKGILENLFFDLGIKKYEFASSNHPNFHPKRQAHVFIDKMNVGVIGEVHPNILSVFDLPNRIFFTEINTTELFSKYKEEKRFTSVATFPESIRDWTLSLSKDFSFHSIMKIVSSVSSSILEDVTLLDLFEGKPLLETQKNVTLRFVYRGKNKTLSYDEVEKEHNRIKDIISSKLKEFLQNTNTNT